MSYRTPLTVQSLCDVPWPNQFGSFCEEGIETESPNQYDIIYTSIINYITYNKQHLSHTFYQNHALSQSCLPRSHGIPWVFEKFLDRASFRELSNQAAFVSKLA